MFKSWELIRHIVEIHCFAHEKNGLRSVGDTILLILLYTASVLEFTNGVKKKLMICVVYSDELFFIQISRKKLQINSLGFQ